MTEDEIKQLDHNFNFIVKEVKRLEEQNKILSEKILKLESNLKHITLNEKTSSKVLNKKIAVIANDLINIKGDIQNANALRHARYRK